MKHRINKMAAVFIASIFALSGLGVAYAAWTDTITLTGTVTTGTLKWELSGIPTQGDPGFDYNCFWDLDGGTWVLMDKDVASTTVEYEAGEHPHIMTVTIDNAYPYYANHIGFKVHYYGSIPARIWKVRFLVDDVLVEELYNDDWWVDPYVYLDISGPEGVPDGNDDIEIWWGNPLEIQMHDCLFLDRSFEILVLQPAPQDDTLEFDIEYVCVQWNEWTSSAP